MHTTWIVAADSTRARILQVAGRDRRLVEVEELVNPAGRMNDRELVTDAYPRNRGAGMPGSDPQQTGAVEHQVERFAKEIGRTLDKARTEHKYDRLYLVAPPKFLGLMRKELGKEVEKLVGDDLDKNLSWFDAGEIDRYLGGAGKKVG